MPAAEEPSPSGAPSPASPPAHPAAPRYPAITLGATMLRLYASLCLLLGLAILVCGLLVGFFGAGEVVPIVPEFIAHPAALALGVILGILGVGCCGAGVRLLMVASLSVAVRDIARNSFK